MTTRVVSFLSALAAASATPTPWATQSQPMTRRLDDGDGDDMSWMNGFTVLYENCFHSAHVVTFRLCPEGDSCEAGCEGGGEYVVDLNFFIDAFTEAQMGAHEYRCEMARENCQYDDDAVCYENAGLDDCDDQNEDENGFDLQEFLECNQIDDNYYVGPYCAEDNYNIYLGVFSDQYCSIQADSSVFEYTYGYELPYNSTHIVGDECANCREHGADEDKNGDDGDDEDEVLEQCEELWEDSYKCEENLDVDYPDTSGCSYIYDLQNEEQVVAGAPANRSADAKRRKIMIGVLVGAAVIACCAFALCSLAYKKLEDSSDSKKRNLIDEEDKPEDATEQGE
eukprot:CAMPEP_0194027780 /NCGR_PEP_ID=MMETSP0009_2-20130614/1849_1 /TAXON_ID=210454 /ORGANISM="Grammatophora oceanica, Strain CCMP 410" /LENGTH=338 /DNA_ID=CAMNT_0038666951 /DNA_START=28 /DNA_END=1044 /DNA_ORIENTATION=-